MRSVSEWIGKTDDAKVPERVQLRIWNRQKDENGAVHCGISGRPIGPTDKKHLHHKLALCLGGQHRESNLVWTLAIFNLEQAKDEVAQRAKSVAKAKKHLGIRGHQTSLAGPDRDGINARKDERSAKRQGAGKLPVPKILLPPGFVPATERNA